MSHRVVNGGIGGRSPGPSLSESGNASKKREKEETHGFPMLRHFSGTIQCVSGIALGFLFLLAAQPALDTAEALEKLKSFAENYGARLQDFTCNKHTTRQESKLPGTQWKPVDGYAEEINYVNHGESRKLIQVDGKRGMKRGGTKVGGEFALLGHIFGTKAQAEFAFERQEHDVCVFRYHVPETTAPFVVSMGRLPVRLGHGVEVFSVCATGVVTRVDAASDKEPDKGIEMRTSIRFAPVDIGGKTFQMPQTAEDISRVGNNLTKADVTFSGYRKYDSSSSVHFEAQP